MKSSVFLCALALAIAPASAQPELPRALQPKTKEAAPIINAEAKALVETMIARYAGLKSYSDTERVELQGGANMPANFRASFPLEAHLAWQRPAHLRFEGTAGNKAVLGLSDETTMRAVNPEHPGSYVERLQHPPGVVTYPDGHTETMPPDTTPVRLDTAMMESGAAVLGTAFMTEPEFWTRTLKNVKVLALEPDATADGETCRVVNVQAEGDAGDAALIRLWIARSDGLLRRMELSDAGMGANSKIIETHSEVRLNPDLPASTWDFNAPVGAKPIDYFSKLEPHKYDPSIKVGDTLPTFSGDDLNGAPIELNSKSGKATVLCFFTMGMGPYDAHALQGLQKKLGADKLQVVGVSGNGRRERLEKFVADNKLTIPIYFDEGAMNNRLSGVFGVRSWTATLLFGPDGKLRAILGSTRGVDFVDALKKLFPGETQTSLLNAMDDEPVVPAPKT